MNEGWPAPAKVGQVYRDRRSRTGRQIKLDQVADGHAHAQVVAGRTAGQNRACRVKLHQGRLDARRWELAAG